MGTVALGVNVEIAGVGLVKTRGKRQNEDLNISKEVAAKKCVII